MANSEVSQVPRPDFENPPVTGDDDNVKVDDSDNYVFVNQLDTLEEDIKPLPDVDCTTEGNSFVHLNEELAEDKGSDDALAVTDTEGVQVDADIVLEDPSNLNSSGDCESIQQSQDLLLGDAECPLQQFGNSYAVRVEEAEQVPQVEEETKGSHDEIQKLDVPDSICSEQIVGEASVESVLLFKENQETTDMVGVQSDLGDEKLVELVSEITPAGSDADLGVEVSSFETEEDSPSDFVKDIVPESVPIIGSVEKSSTESNPAETIQGHIVLEIPLEGPLVHIEAEDAHRSASFETGCCLPTNTERVAVQQINVRNDSVETENPPKPNDFIEIPEVEVVDISSAVDVMTPVGSNESLVIGSDVDMVNKLDIASGPSLLTEDFQSSAADDMILGDAPQPAALCSENFSSPLVEGREARVEDGFTDSHDISRCSYTGNKSENLSVLNSNNDEEKTPDFSPGDVGLDQKPSDIAAEMPSNPSESNGKLKPVYNLEHLAEVEAKLIVSPVADLKSEAVAESMSASQGIDETSEVGTDNISALQGRVVTVMDTSVSEADASNFADNSVSSLKSIPAEADNGNEGDCCSASDAGALICPKYECIQEVQVIETLASSEGSSVGTSDGHTHTADAEVERKPFYYLIRIPRYDDENVREQIKIAQQEVEKKTQIRDAIRSEIQKRREICQRCSDALEAALLEERTARGILNSKRKEIDSAQSVINRVKNAMSVEDINYRIRNVEHRMQHETLPLIEEKQLIRELKKLNHFRETLSSSMGRPDELQRALDQKDEIEERLKVLKMEMDPLRENSLKAELASKVIRKKYHEEVEIFRKSQAEFKAADITRQKAYALLLSLKKEFYEKNKYFRSYKEEEKAAHDYADSRDNEALQRLCISQVETVMELWNKNDEFRREYVRCNIRSTLRRLGAGDGRSLGPDKEPSVLLNTRIHKSVHLPAENKPVSVPPSDHENSEIAVKSEDKLVAEVVMEKKQTIETKCATEPAILENVSVTMVGNKESKELQKEPTKTKEEEELVRKEEELRKIEEEAKLKEQRRLEEKLKAKEALERKKRNLEKAQARAELRAQKEAEQREKEREKRARRKERKKAEVISGDIEGDSVARTESSKEIPKGIEMKEKSVTVAKKSQKTSHYSRHLKSKSVPLPIRNRGRRKMLQSWLWVLLPFLFVYALFVLGNSNLSSRLGRQNFHI